jgi:hypothetical protein
MTLSFTLFYFYPLFNILYDFTISYDWLWGVLFGPLLRLFHVKSIFYT